MRNYAQPAARKKGFACALRCADTRNWHWTTKPFSPSRYLMPDDGYDLNRQLGEMWADAADEKDVDPAAHFEESDRLIARALFMLAAGAILSLGLVFYALVESLGIVSRHARWLLIVGTLLSAAGVILAILTQLDLV